MKFIYQDQVYFIRFSYTPPENLPKREVVLGMKENYQGRTTTCRIVKLKEVIVEGEEKCVFISQGESRNDSRDIFTKAVGRRKALSNALDSEMSKEFREEVWNCYRHHCKDLALKN